MCSDDDIQWIEDFYDRIINQTDPLALYRQATQSRHIPDKKAKGHRPQECYNKHHQNVRKPSCRGITLPIVVVIVALVVICGLLEYSSSVIQIPQMLSDFVSFITAYFS